jgi:hypothetical protein
MSIEAMKQMVEALEIAAEGGGVDFYAYAKEGRQAIAEASQNGLYCEGYRNGYAFGEAAGKRQAIAEAEKQEPVAWQWLTTAHFRKKLPKDAEKGAWNPLYTTPQQRTWVGLTDEERKTICEANNVYHDGLIEDIEAKLKEKNNDVF